jgi:hypothetical protein
MLAVKASTQCLSDSALEARSTSGDDSSSTSTSAVSIHRRDKASIALRARPGAGP